MLVPLVGRLSNLDDRLQRVFAALERTGWPEILVDQPADQKSPGQSSTVRNPRQPNRKLKPAEVDELAARYEAGGTLRALAARFGVRRGGER